MTLDELVKRINEYCEKGYYNDVAEAHRYATRATRDFIARTHPKVAFGGKKMGDEQFKIYKKEFEIVGPGHINSMVYANYFARWYNTGAFGGPINVKKDDSRFGNKGTKYPPRGKYFEQNKEAIEDYFISKVDEYLQKNIKL